MWSATEETYTKVEKAENLSVGQQLSTLAASTIIKRFFQKINTFYINDSRLSCSDRFVQIIFLVLNDKSIEVQAEGFLTETGGVRAVQQIRSC